MNLGRLEWAPWFLMSTETPYSPTTPQFPLTGHRCISLMIERGRELQTLALSGNGGTFVHDN